jgi:translation initiation factor IF-3
MRRKWRKAKPKPMKDNLLANERIKVPEIYLIDENGERKGNMPTEEAIVRAKEMELDLVLVNPKGDPPVAKIVDLGQLKYERDKKIHKQKLQQKKIETKAVRLSVRISKHDFDFRLNQAIKFLGRGDKLKIELILKGRERQHPAKAAETIKEFVLALEENEGLDIIKEQDLTKQGARFTIVLLNKSN